MNNAAGRLIAAVVFASLAIGAFEPAASAGTTPPVTTVIVHGFSTTEKGAWVEGMAEAILARAGGGSIYRYTGESAAWTYVPSSFADGSNDAIVCIFNWVPESDAPDVGPNWNYAQAAGDALYAALRDPRFVGAPGPPPPTLIENRWLHLIGHSRGACVCSETVLRFARDGRAVDHMTALDPHPVNGTLDWPVNFNWNDPTPARWSNLTFLDNYWRADGGFFNAADFDGIPLNGAFNTELDEDALDCCANSLAHLDVHLWLHGTIDLSPEPCDGDMCIDATARATWWPEGFTQRGWFYSRLGGGSSLRPAQGATVPPPPTAFIMNGDFANVTHAGWGFHGGTVGGAIVNEGGAQFLKIGTGFGGGAASRHNRLFVPAGASTIELDTRVLTAGSVAGEVLRISLIDQSGASVIVADDPIPTSIGRWVVNRQFAIPPTLQRGRTHSLAFQIVSNGAPAAVLGIDNIDLIVESIHAADVNADGCINVTDLLAVISAWGPCGVPPIECDADVSADGSVNVTDLLAVISAWGCG